jgi:hypothetical protein
MSEPLAMDQEVTVTLTMAEALILSDCLGRLYREDLLAPHVDAAEQVALWAIDAVLERWNPVIFSDDYAKHLQEAKSHITRGMDE